MADVKLADNRREALRLVAQGGVMYHRGWRQAPNYYTAPGDQPVGVIRAIRWLHDQRLASAVTGEVRLTPAGIDLAEKELAGDPALLDLYDGFATLAEQRRDKAALGLAPAEEMLRAAQKAFNDAATVAAQARLRADQARAAAKETNGA